MSDLYLTDPELESLRETHQGLHTLVVAWRRRTTGEWLHATPRQLVSRPDGDCKMPPRRLLQCEYPPDADAIVITVNLIELSAAEALHQKEAGYHKAGMLCGNDDSVRRYHADLYKIRTEKLVAIRAALKDSSQS